MTATALGGALIRRDDGWYWRTNEREPRVRDLSVSAHYNFRCRGNADQSYVEVPRGRAQEELDLQWVLDGRYTTSASGDHTGPLKASGQRTHSRPGEDPLQGAEIPGPIPRVILVPIGEWDAWAANTAHGAEWDRADEEAILDRARELGWDQPR